MRFPTARFLARALSQTLPHLAIFAVMLFSLAPGATSFWECQGQKCGVTDWTCCCEQPNERNTDCAKLQSHFTRGEHASEAGACQADCHCTMVVEDQKPSVSSAQFSFAPSVFVVVPLKFAPTFEAPILTELPRLQLSRGPPLRTLYLASFHLRGPPVA